MAPNTIDMCRLTFVVVLTSIPVLSVRPNNRHLCFEYRFCFLCLSRHQFPSHQTGNHLLSNHVNTPQIPPLHPTSIHQPSASPHCVYSRKILLFYFFPIFLLFFSYPIFSNLLEKTTDGVIKAAKTGDLPMVICKFFPPFFFFLYFPFSFFVFLLLFFLMMMISFLNYD